MGWPVAVVVVAGILVLGVVLTVGLRELGARSARSAATEEAQRKGETAEETLLRVRGELADVRESIARMHQRMDAGRPG